MRTIQRRRQQVKHGKYCSGLCRAWVYRDLESCIQSQRNGKHERCNHTVGPCRTALFHHDLSSFECTGVQVRHRVKCGYASFAGSMYGHKKQQQTTGVYWW